MSDASSPAPTLSSTSNTSIVVTSPPTTAVSPPLASASPPAPAPVPPTVSPPLTSPPPSSNNSSSSSPVTSAPPPSVSAPPSSPPVPSSSNSTSPSLASPPPPPSSSSHAPPISLTPPPPPPARASTTPSVTTTSSSSPSSSSQVSGTAVIGVGVAAVLAAIVISVLLYCFCCRKNKRKGYYYGPPGGPPAHYKPAGSRRTSASDQQQWRSHSSHSSNGSEIPTNLPPPPPPFFIPPSPGPNTGSRSWFTYEELAKATDDFSKSNLLGQGGFGSVFKGVLTDGRIVAVKKLKAGGGQGEKEFQAEVEIISRVHHRHLVSLVGYCTASRERLLVYDFVPNRTLEYHLHGNKHGSVMDWATRLKIACGAARGLAYLHEDCHPRIIHRDIKSSNILLDNNFEAQVSDFGLAKLTSDTNTHVTTRVMGTFGYLAPEYASSGKLTEKSDVFSFGVVLLELITGRKPIDQSFPQGEESLVEWARALLKQQVNGEEDLDVVADPALNGSFNRKEMLRMTQAAAACIRHAANKRPKMSQIVRALEDDASFSDLTRGLKPGHSSVYGSSYSSADYDNMSYTAEMRKFRKTALESQEFGGSEYSGNTSEYNHPSASSSEYHTSKEVARNKGNIPSTSTSNEFS